MLLEELKHFLKINHLSPKFELGQNFLMNEDVLDEMVATAELGLGDAVVEIGPGIGNLTRRLVATGANVLSIEKDTDFENVLEKISKEHPNFRYILGDALKTNFLEELEALGWKGRVKIVANIPYYLTGTLMRLLSEKSDKIFSLTLLVQKEVAENVTALPGHLSLSGIALQLVAEAKIITRVPAADFYPAPKVESAVVHARVYHPKKYIVEDEKKLFKMLHAAFLGKRKQIHNTLKNNLGLPKEKVEAALTKTKIAFETRPQELSIEQWIELYKNLFQ